MCRHLLFAATLAVAALGGCAGTPAPPPVDKPVKLALALGGGAARGFAHVGVIKTLVSQGIFSDTAEAPAFVARSVGRNAAGDVASEFEVEWSFKRRD